jgi:membrane protease YdiL (CAAX protease family)
MKISKTAKLLSNITYIIGVAVFLVLLGFVLFGANYIPYPDHMMRYSMRDIAFIYLAVGAIPMLLVSIAVYNFNDVKTSKHKKRNLILLFLPGFLCGICLLVIAIGFVLLLFQGLRLALADAGGG